MSRNTILFAGLFLGTILGGSLGKAFFESSPQEECHVKRISSVIEINDDHYYVAQDSSVVNIGGLLDGITAHEVRWDLSVGREKWVDSCEWQPHPSNRP